MLGSLLPLLLWFAAIEGTVAFGLRGVRIGRAAAFHAARQYRGVRLAAPFIVGVLVVRLLPRGHDRVVGYLSLLIAALFVAVTQPGVELPPLSTR